MIDYSPQQYAIKDVDTLQAISNEVGEDVLSTLLDLFLNESATLFEELPLCLQKQDVEACTRLLHSIKSGAKTYGAVRLAALAAELEAAARCSNLADVELHIACLESALRETFAEYRSKN
ncbi:Hpt domain-containing protein [Aestuariibacter salexigens]|uniref:Hpt domain-containing protein n=1 Tax=Aestuariibacter salexigens TaxID=226010 RepID=UPI00146F9C41|nr:Hpt domain-containing protein [Aestuariibacter salexigens]